MGFFKEPSKIGLKNQRGSLLNQTCFFISFLIFPLGNFSREDNYNHLFPLSECIDENSASVVTYFLKNSKCVGILIPF